jgi:hypothetical protein
VVAVAVVVTLAELRQVALVHRAVTTVAAVVAAALHLALVQ